MAAGGFAITPYGRTMHVLRAEKGYIIVGQDTDGSITPIDLGMDWIVAKDKDFLGRRSRERADTARSDRKHLVGLLTGLQAGDVLFVDEIHRMPRIVEEYLYAAIGPRHVELRFSSISSIHALAPWRQNGGRYRVDEKCTCPYRTRRPWSPT